MHFRTAFWAFLICGIVAGSIYGVATILGDAPPTKEVALWIVATAVPVVFIALILAALERREPQDKELIMIVIILGSAFMFLVEMLIAALIGPPVE